jgi:hypothetical protein
MVRGIKTFGEYVIREPNAASRLAEAAARREL